MKHNNNKYTTEPATLLYPQNKNQPNIKPQKQTNLVSPIFPKPTHTKNTSNANLLGSFSTSTVTTTTSQLKSTSSKGSIAKNIPLLILSKPKEEEEKDNISCITNQANAILSKSKNKHNLQLHTHDAIINSDLNDTHLEDILEIEGKKILNKLSNTFKMTTQGNFVINTKMYLRTTNQKPVNNCINDTNENEIKERDFISNLINSRCQVSHLPSSRKEKKELKIQSHKTEESSLNTIQHLNKKINYIESSSIISSKSKESSKTINSQLRCNHINILNNNKQNVNKKINKLHQGKKCNTTNNKGDSKSNEEEIMNFLLQSTYEKTKNIKKIKHNKIKSFPVLSSSRGKVLKHVCSNKSIQSVSKVKNN